MFGLSSYSFNLFLFVYKENLPTDHSSNGQVCHVNYFFQDLGCVGADHSLDVAPKSLCQEFKFGRKL